MVEATQTKSVLVCFGESKKRVSFPCSDKDADVEKKAFLDAVYYEFCELLPSPPPPLIIQLKGEDWEGEFVDLAKDAKIPHHSVVRVISVNVYAKVSMAK